MKYAIWVAVLSMPVFDPALLCAEEPEHRTPLDDYVAQNDDSYKWKVVRSVAGPGFTTYVIDMTSQRWRTDDDVDRPLWQHWLVSVKPDGAKFDTSFLMIGGGRNDGRPPERPDEKIVALALTTGSVVSELRMIPNQPLVFHGDGVERYEDDLIAYAWDQYLKTDDPTWLPRLPMVKSAVRAMDTIQTFYSSDDAGGLNIEQFVIAGGSKRGWTTWMTAAVDDRVAAIVPIVIDVLNVKKSMDHHYGAYGFWAPAIGDYVRHKLTDRADTPEYEALLKIADPYFYRQRFTMPKFIVNSAGDQFFLPDSSRFYYDDLPEPKYLRYVPNSDHSLRETDALESIQAFYLAILTGAPIPKITWELPDANTISVAADSPAIDAKLWQATNTEARDFRLEAIGPTYASSPVAVAGENRYVASVRQPEKGWTAFFIELTFESRGQHPFKFTSPIRIAPDKLLHTRPKTTESVEAGT